MIEPLLAFGLIEKALFASTLLGLMCGILGTFVVVRKISLVGDAVSHAILPGIVLGFIVSSAMGLNRNPWIIFACASIVGLFSMFTVHQVLSTTRLKSDAALGIILSGFFGIGLFMKSSLIDFIDNSGGLNTFLFGNMATISNADLQAVIITGAILITLTLLLLRPFILISFDSLFAETLGYPTKVLNLIFYTLLTVTIVVSVQAVGVILVTSMLVIPASTAFLLTDRKLTMMMLSMGFGAASGLIGAYLSISVKSANVASGAVMTLVAATFFLVAYLGAPSHGIIAKWLKQKRLRKNIEIENSLKTIFHINEIDGDPFAAVSISDFSEKRRFTDEHSKAYLKKLDSADFLTLDIEHHQFALSEKGVKRAQQIVRNHRLWELYLTSQADYKSDHVHDDAELIEHLLDEETVRKLEIELGNPQTDPHGKPIPQPLAHL